MQRKVVVLPQPEGPSRVKKVPGSSVKLAPRMPPAIASVVFTKVLLRPRTSRPEVVAFCMITKPLRSLAESVGRLPAHEDVERDGEQRHQQGPEQAERRELGELAVDG